MTSVKIRTLRHDEELPMSLLLLADPSKDLVVDYTHRGMCYVLETDDEIIGTYVLLPTRPLTIEIVNIAVAEVHRGKGHGKALVSHAVQTARNLGYETIEVGTGNSSIAELALYQKCGFRMTSIDRDYFIRHYPEPIYENGMQCI